MRKIMAVVLAFCMMLGCTLSGMAFTALDNDENIVRIGIMADAHIFDNSKAVNDVITAFEALDESLDGIVMGGDIVANAPTELLPNLYDAAVADTKLSAYLAKKPAVEIATRTIDEAEYSVGTNSGEGSLVWVMGNHEFNTNNNDVAQPEAWKLFQEKTGFGIRGNVKMGGYHFIYSAAQGYIGRYTEEDQNWMLDELKAVLADENYAGKPVFLVLHHPIPESYHDTTNGANGSNFITGHYTEEFVSFVKSQPRIIEFSAHTHYPIQDPRMIRQPELGGFTAVQIPFAGNGTFTLDRSADVRTASQEDSYGQALMLEIDKTTNIVTIKRLNIATGEFIGNDWTVDVAALQNGNGYSYTDSRFENGEAPVFSDGDVAVTNIAQSTATITFPAATKFSAATETSYANIYDVKVVNKNTNVVEFSKTMCSDYYKLSPADSFSIDVDNLEADTAYIAKITAISPYGAQSDVKSGEFTTESAVAEGGEALSKIVIDVNSEIEKSTLDKASDHYGGWIGGGSRTQIISKITPEITGVYDISVLASFTSDAPDMTVFVDGIEVNTVATSIATGLSSPTKYEIGSIGLLAGKTYTVELSCAKATGGYANYWYNTTLVCNREIGVGDIVVTGDKVLPGVDDQGENPKVTLKALNYVGSAANNDQRWNNWISGEAYAVLWNFTPEFTGMYDFTTDVKFSSNGKDGYASVYIDGVQLTDWVPATPGSATVETLNLGSALLIEGKTYEIKVKLKNTSDGITGAIYGAAINCSGKASDDALAENANIELRANDTSNIISHNYNGCNSDRFHWWNGEGNAFIEWGITPLATGIYEISALAGYSLESYSETPYLEAYIDGNKVGEAQYPEDFTDSAPDRNKETFGKLLLEGGKTYTLRLLLKGGGYNVYLKGMDVKFLRSPQTEDFWQDSVIVNGWEPAEKYTAGEVENYGVIIAQKNHYATYKVNPGEGFFKLSITYGAGSSLTGNAPITLNVNGKDLGTIIAPDNDCYWPSAGNAACTLDLGVIKLKEGENTITLGHEGSTDVYYSVGKVMVEAIKAPIESLYRGKYVDSDALITDVVNGEMTAYAQLPRSMAGKSLTAVFAVYESKANGKKLVAVASDSFDIDTTGEISLTVENVVTSSASSYSYRIFYVEADNSLNPIF